MPLPDRALRRLVVELAALHAEDVRAVLAELDPAQRPKVEALLQEFSDFGFAEKLVPAPDNGVAIDSARLSPWLVGRCNGSDAAMTAHSRAVLLACAGRLYPAPRAEAPVKRQSGFAALTRPFLRRGSPA